MEDDVNDELGRLLRWIVEQAQKLTDKHTREDTARVNYACIFSQNTEEYDMFIRSANKMGKVIRDTPTGPLFNIKPLETKAGKLRLIKIRLPDKTRPERGDADFTVSDYSTFKKSALENSLENCRSEVKIERAYLGSGAALQGGAYYSLTRLAGNSF